MERFTAFWRKDNANKAATIFVALFILIVLGSFGNYGRGNGGLNSTPIGIDGATRTPRATNTPKATATPEHAAVWTTTQTFSGNGTKKTATFQVAKDWKLIWTCDPTKVSGGEYYMGVSVYNDDGTALDVAAVNTLCKAGVTGDETQEHIGGAVYIDVNAGGPWTIQVQELK